VLHLNHYISIQRFNR